MVHVENYPVLGLKKNLCDGYWSQNYLVPTMAPSYQGRWKRSWGMRTTPVLLLVLNVLKMENATGL